MREIMGERKKRKKKQAVWSLKDKNKITQVLNKIRHSGDGGGKIIKRRTRKGGGCRGGGSGAGGTFLNHQTPSHVNCYRHHW